jgi:hypothetical protein
MVIKDGLRGQDVPREGRSIRHTVTSRACGGRCLARVLVTRLGSPRPDRLTRNGWTTATGGGVCVPRLPPCRPIRITGRTFAPPCAKTSAPMDQVFPVNIGSTDRVLHAHFLSKTLSWQGIRIDKKIRINSKAMGRMVICHDVWPERGFPHSVDFGSQPGSCQAALIRCSGAGYSG